MLMLTRMFWAESRSKSEFRRVSSSCDPTVRSGLRYCEGDWIPLVIDALPKLSPASSIKSRFSCSLLVALADCSFWPNATPVPCAGRIVTETF